MSIPDPDTRTEPGTDADTDAKQLLDTVFADDKPAHRLATPAVEKTKPGFATPAVEKILAAHPIQPIPAPIPAPAPPPAPVPAETGPLIPRWAVGTSVTAIGLGTAGGIGYVLYALGTAAASAVTTGMVATAVVVVAAAVVLVLMLAARGGGSMAQSMETTTTTTTRMSQSMRGRR